MSTDNNQLPPLPTPPHRFAVELTPTGKRLDYTAEDMHAYALAALAQRQGEPVKVYDPQIDQMLLDTIGFESDDLQQVNRHDLLSVARAAIALAAPATAEQTWRSHDNTGMRHPEECDLSGGATEAPAPVDAAALLEMIGRARRKLATYVSVYPGDKELRKLLVEWDAALNSKKEST